MLVSRLLKCAKPLVQHGAAAESVSKTAAETVGKEANPMFQKAKDLIAQKGWTQDLLGVRGNIAITKGSSPYGGEINATHFYDISGEKLKWLKTKCLSGKSESAFGGCNSRPPVRFPNGSAYLRQRVDRYPEQVKGFDAAIKYVTRAYDKFGKLLQKTIVKRRESKYCARTVREEIQDLISNKKYIDLDPVTKPTNGTIRAGNINGSRYHHKSIYDEQL